MFFDEVIKEYEDKGILKKNTIVDRFLEVAGKYADKKAIYDSEHEITYKEMADKILAMGGFLKTQGIDTGDRVLLHINNSIDYAVALLGTMAAGAIPVLLLQEHRQEEISCIGNEVEAKGYITVNSGFIKNWKEMTEEVIRNVSGLKVILTKNANEIITEKKVFSLKDAYSNREYTENLSKYNVEAVFLLSGGTTGKPKIIPKLQEAYLYNIEKCMERSRFDETTVYLTPLSVSHDFALANPGMLGALLAGGTVVLPETPFPDDAFEMIEAHRVNTITIVPALLKAWLDAMEYNENDLSSLRLVITGAAKIDEKLGNRVEKTFGVKIQNGYGLGEGITCFTSIDDENRIILNTQGKPISEYDSIKIIDEDGRELPQGEAGELTEKGPYTFGGYYKNDELNRRLFTSDGYFCTGDKAMLDDAGNLVILGRVREQINRAGENVIPSEVESLLRRCTGIIDAAVFGVEDEKLGEKTVAALIAEKEKSRKEIAEEITLMGGAVYKIPDEIFYLDKFPYKNIGKVDKKELYRLYQKERKAKNGKD